MRQRLKMALCNLALFYTGLMLIMSVWGTTSSILKRRTWPAMAAPPANTAPTFLEMLGFWPPGTAGYHRLLRLGLPLRALKARRLI